MMLQFNRRILLSTALAVFAIITCVTVEGLSSGSSAFQNNRHVCLFHNYEAIRGPHFYALFDQLCGQTGFSSKRLIYVHAGEKTDQNDSEEILQKKRTIQEELNIEIVYDISLTKCDNPSTLRKIIVDMEPSIIWVGDHHNAFELRHLLRITALDKILGELCGPDSGNACLFVGEGAASLCAGSSMAVANLHGDDPNAAAELQFRGLELLGTSRCIAFGEDKREHKGLRDQLTTLPFYDGNYHSAFFLNKKQVYIYSQKSAGDTTSLIMNPYQKGAIEQYESSSLPPVPPLYYFANDLQGTSSVARACTGEPSEDPSRTIRTSHVQEGDYW